MSAPPPPPYSSGILHLPIPSLAECSARDRATIAASLARVARRLTIHVHAPGLQHRFDGESTHERWRETHNFLTTAYVSAARTAYELDRMLCEVDVIFDGWCGYVVGVEDDNGDGSGYQVVFGRREDEPRVREYNIRRAKASLEELQVELLDIPGTSEGDNGRYARDCNKTNAGLPKRRYRCVAVGGTFDHLHAGHKILLTMTASITDERLICGVSGENMLATKKYRDYIEPLSTRIAKVGAFLQRIRRDLVYEVVPIYDVCGPTATDATIEAVVVSRETVSGAQAINEERARKDLPPLDFAVIDVISSSNPSLLGDELKQLKMSSTFLREYLATKVHSQPVNSNPI